VKIDVATHFLPPAYAERFEALEPTPATRNLRGRLRGIPAILDLDARLQQLEEFGDEYRQIISLPGPPVEVVGPPEVTRDLARIGNDAQAELVRERPERFAGFAAALPLNDVDASVAELERAVTDLGALGAQIYTNVVGKPWDDPELDPVLAKAAELDCAIWAHPTRTSGTPDYRTEEKSRYEIWWALGWPYDTAAFMARIVFSGLFDRYPGIRIITHHGGGFIPHVSGRLGPGWDQLGERTPPEEGDLVRTPIRGRPVDYFKRFYTDTAMMDSAHALACVIAFFGVDRVLFASDSPFDPEKGPGFIRATISNVEELALSDGDKAAIYSGNAERLLLEAGAS
jgi:aminocarboxymuconate-semialdehyde decarboxylase